MYASDYRARARQCLAGKWFIAVLVAFLASLLGGSVASGGFQFNLNISEEQLSSLPPTVIYVIGILISIAGVLSVVHLVLGGPVSAGYSRYLLKNEDGKVGEVKDLFSCFDIFAQAFVMRLLSGIFIALWSLLFVIPGIVASYKYAMAPFILAEQPELSGSDAITASKNLMYGHKWQLFCLDLSFIGWNLLSLVTLGISTLFVAPYHAQAHAAFYRQLTLQASNPTF